MTTKRQGQTRIPFGNDTKKASTLDFDRRADPADLPEWMDEPCSYAEFRDCVADLGSVNRWTFGYRPTLSFLRQVAKARSSSGQRLRVVDVGSGGGDTLRRIALWAWRRKIGVELTGIDLNPHATEAAREFSAADKRFAAIRWVTGNVYAEPAAQSCDLVLSALMTHHMRDAEVVQFLRWMEKTARRGWFINDLLRSAKAYRLFRILAKVKRWHPFVQHDGPVSIRRAFREEDWRRLLAEAGVPLDGVRMEQPVPGRLCVTRLK